MVDLIPVDKETGQLLRDRLSWQSKPADPFTYVSVAHSQEDRGWVRDGIWVPNDPFRATLSFLEIEDGMIVWIDLSKRAAERVKYPMFPTEAQNALLLAVTRIGVGASGRATISGEFDVVKRSTRYGYRWLGV